MFNLLAVTSFTGMIEELGTIISSCFTVFTSNWLLTGTLVVAVGIPVLGSVIGFFKNR